MWHIAFTKPLTQLKNLRSLHIDCIADRKTRRQQAYVERLVAFAGRCILHFEHLRRISFACPPPSHHRDGGRRKLVGELAARMEFATGLIPTRRMASATEAAVIISGLIPPATRAAHTSAGTGNGEAAAAATAAAAAWTVLGWKAPPGRRIPWSDDRYERSVPVGNMGLVFQQLTGAHRRVFWCDYGTTSVGAMCRRLLGPDLLPVSSSSTATAATWGQQCQKQCGWHETRYGCLRMLRHIDMESPDRGSGRGATDDGGGDGDHHSRDDDDDEDDVESAVEHCWCVACPYPSWQQGNGIVSTARYITRDINAARKRFVRARKRVYW